MVSVTEKAEELTQERLKELLHYEPETGVFCRKVSVSSRAMSGDRVGTKNDQGYLMVTLDRMPCFVHRIAFLYMMGRWPYKMDHINHDRSDNRWSNLREVTAKENNKNMSLASHNTSGFTGVSWCKTHKKWYAKIQVNGKAVRLGGFDDKDDAIACRQAANIKYGFHPNHGKQGATNE